MPRPELLARSLEASGFGRALRRTGRGWRGALVLSYGRIGDPESGDFSRDLYTTTQDELDAQLGYLRRNFELVDCADGLRAAYSRDGRAVAVSFDGGYADGHHLALPVLAARDVPATFFIPPGCIDDPRVPWWDELAAIVRATDRRSITITAAGRPLALALPDDREPLIAELTRTVEGLRVDQVDGLVADLAAAAGVPRCTPEQAKGVWLTWDEIRELRAGGMLIGSQTVGQPVLDRAEILGGVARIAEETGLRPTCFAHAAGAAGPPSPETVAVLREAGITHAFSRGGYHASRQVSDPFDLPRIPVGPGVSEDLFRATTTLPRLIAPHRRGPPADPTRSAEPPASIDEPAAGGDPPPGAPTSPPPASPPPAGDPVAGAAWASSTRRGLVWSVATFIGAKALTFVAVLILARILLPADFGVLAGVLAFLALIELGSDLGMKAAVIYEQEDGVSPRVQTAFTLNLGIAVALTVVGVLISPLVAGLFGAQDHVWLFRLASLNLLLTGLGNIHDALLLRDMGFDRRIRPQVARDFIRGAIAIALALDGVGAASLVIGHLAGTAAWCAFQWRLSPLRPNFSLDRRIARSMVAYGGQSAALEVLAVFATRIDVVVIGSALGTSALGIYSVAYRLPDILIGSLAYTVTVVAFPALSRKRDEDHGGLERATLQLLRFQGLYAFPVAAATAVLAAPLVVVLFSDRWRGAAPVMVAVALAAAVSTSTFALGDLLKAVGRQRFIVILNLIDIPLLVLGTPVAAHHGGITAVAWVIFVLQVWFGILLAAFARRAMDVRWTTIGRAFVPGLATGAGVAVAGAAVRFAYPADSIPGLLAGAVACAAGGLIALRLLAHDTFVDLRRQLADLVPSRAGAPRPTAVVPTAVATSPPADAPRPPDQRIRSQPMPGDKLENPARPAREAAERVALVIAEAAAEAAALRAAAGREATARHGAAIGEARQIVDLARATGHDVAAAIESVSTTAAALEARLAALRELSTGPIESAAGLDGSADVEAAIRPLIARAEADAEALVRRASTDAVHERGVAIAEAELIAEVAQAVSRSSRKVITRLERLAAANAKLEARALALSDAASIHPRPPIDASPPARSPDPATPPGGGEGPAGGSSQAELMAARHVALGLAVAGTPREQVARHLRDALHLADPEPVLDHVFGPPPPGQGRGH